MDRADALSTIREVAAEVLSVDPDQVVETARFKEDLEGVTTIGQAVDLVLSKAGA